ncbi:MAG: secondary thiamine-phosphate synthase enzyme YjbQ [Phycisphaerae bacterium]
MVVTQRLRFSTRGNCEVLDINDDVIRVVVAAGIHNGIVCVHVVGSTASITTTESEPGLITHDLAAFFEKIAPASAYYKHEETWNDDNGHAHIRASLLGPSISVPLIDGNLALGTWQQIVLIDFDTRKRQREVIVQIVGE